MKISSSKRPLIYAIAGWLPAIIFPTATLFQLIPALQGKTEGISIVAWTMFGFANLGAYLFSTQKLTIQIVLAFLLSSMMDFAIVLLCLLKL